MLDLGERLSVPERGRARAGAGASRRAADRPADRHRWAGSGRVAGSRRAARARLIALVHHPLALESGLSSGDAAALRVSEAEALACARRVIVTSASTARLVVSDYGVAAERVTIVRPGNDRVAPARVHAEGPIELLAVGAVVPRKGYDVLLAAVATLLDLPWRLTIVGDLERDAEATARLRADIARFHLADRVVLTGAVQADRLEALYAGSDIFVLASRFEGYGMAFTEAIAHGLPVIGTTAGAIPETAPAGASLLAPPDDIGSVLVGRAAADRGFRRAPPARRGGAGGRGRASHLGTGGGAVLSRHRGGGVTRFSADWLALREPYDARARNPAVLDALAAAVAGRGSLDDRRSRLRRRRDLACDLVASSEPPALAARRPRSRAARARIVRAGRRRRGRDGPGRYRPRDRSCARRTRRSGDGVGAARSRLRRLARSAGEGDRRAPATVLRGAHLRRASHVRTR